MEQKGWEGGDETGRAKAEQEPCERLLMRYRRIYTLAYSSLFLIPSDG